MLNEVGWWAGSDLFVREAPNITLQAKEWEPKSRLLWTIVKNIFWRTVKYSHRNAKNGSGAGAD